MKKIMNYKQFNENKIFDEYNIIYSPKDFDSEYLENTLDTAVNYFYETDLDLEKEELVHRQIVYTNQNYLNMDFVDDMDQEKYDKSDIILVEDKLNRLWLLNGHHRLVYDRKNRRNSMVYIIREKEIDYINRIIYGEGEDDI